MFQGKNITTRPSLVKVKASVGSAPKQMPKRPVGENLNFKKRRTRLLSMCSKRVPHTPFLPPNSLPLQDDGSRCQPCPDSIEKY